MAVTTGPGNVTVLTNVNAPLTVGGQQVSELQTLTFTGATAGTKYTLSFNGATTSTITYTGSASDYPSTSAHVK